MKMARRMRRQPCRLVLLTLNRIVRESGDLSRFDGPAWLADWVSRPCPALGFRAPADLLTTAAGRRSVVNLLRQMQSGTYA